MPSSFPVFDGLLALMLVWLAVQVFLTRDLFKAVVLFIVFGLLLALAWVRLRAPDVALAEAAIGAGLTGALLLRAVISLRAAGLTEDGNPQRSFAAIVICALCSVAIAGMLAWSTWSLPDDWAGLTAPVAAAMPLSGVQNPVTAALLNFRSYDTLMEIAVLMAAALGVWTLDGEAPGVVTAPSPALTALLRVLLPLLVLMAGYLVWVGAHAPGGAFQAAAMLAAGGVLVHMTQPFSLREHWPARLLLGIGFAVFLVVALSMMMFGGRFLEYPPEQAGAWILMIEATATVSIAFILLTLFVGPPWPRRN